MDEFPIFYSSADAYETGYGWNLAVGGRSLCFTTKEEAEKESGIRPKNPALFQTIRSTT
jgi:hypothetical protein